MQEGDVLEIEKVAINKTIDKYEKNHLFNFNSYACNNLFSK